MACRVQLREPHRIDAEVEHTAAAEGGVEHRPSGLNSARKPRSAITTSGVAEHAVIEQLRITVDFGWNLLHIASIAKTPAARAAAAMSRRLARAQRDRLLDEHVLAGSDRKQGVLTVLAVGGPM